MRKLLTIYGRKPVLEALNDCSLEIRRLHLASSNRPAEILEKIIALANARAIATEFHDKPALARISRNAKQDQGVAADIALPSLRWIDELDSKVDASRDSRYLLCDGIHNPQNLGMIIRSAAAAGIAGLIIPEKGNASISPLVVKASAGALFRCPLLLADNSNSALQTLQQLGIAIYTLEASASASLLNYAPDHACAFVLGNETDGPGEAARRASSGSLRIPMHNGVESLNVAITAALVAYLVV
ncbi:MAG: TrmH family RNA methyltransferase [Pseudomonadales bacterium]